MRPKLMLVKLDSKYCDYLRMHDNVDFLKLKNGELEAVNFNNMLPVTLDNVNMIDLDTKSSVKVEELYRKMLKEQLYFLNRRRASFYGKASNLYFNYINKKLPTNIFNRCCNFPLLEEKCKEYNSVLIDK